ncbi:hypothetical protein ES707_03647 [subsurface metagenome]
MFKVETRPTTERYCPQGHQPLSGSWPGANPVKFCHICGASIKEREVTYDAAVCANCNSPVSPDWDFCPYCGQGRGP